MANDAVVDGKVVRAIDPNGNVLNLRVDASGNLITTGGGSGTGTTKIADGTTPTQLLAVDATGRITVAAIVGALPAGANAIGTVDTELPAAAALSDTLANPTTPQVGAVELNWDGTQNVRRRVPNVVKSATTAASGATSVWTPAAGKKFRIMRYWIGLTGESTQAAGGALTISVRDATTSIGIAHTVFVPAVALNAFGDWTTGWIDIGNGVLSSTANNACSVQLSAALTAGLCSVVFCGTEE